MQKRAHGGVREIEREVAIADRIEPVLRQPGEAQQLARRLPIDGQRRAGNGADTEGQLVHGREHATQCIRVAAKHRAVSRKDVAEADRLRALPVCVGGQDRIGFGARPLCQGRQEIRQRI